MPILIHSLVASLLFLVQHTELPSPFSRGTVFESMPKMSGLTPLYWTPAGYRPIWATGLRKGGVLSQHLTLLKSLQAVWLMWLPMEPRSSTVARSSSTTAKFKNGRLLGWSFLHRWFSDWHIRKLEVVNICSFVHPWSSPMIGAGEVAEVDYSKWVSAHWVIFIKAVSCIVIWI